MEQIQLGAFIKERRLALNLTQKQLADKLGVTDKAVSKWERDVSYPDIALLRPLAEALEVTAAELLAGRLEPAETPASAAEAADSAILYAQQVEGRRGRWRLWIYHGLTASCLLASVVCVICDLAINSRYTWSLVVLLSLVYSWLICAVPLAAQRPGRRLVIILTAATPIFLAALGWVLHEPMVLRISLWVVPMALVWLWIVYLLFLRLRHRKWLATGLSLILTVPVSIGINESVNRLIGSPGGFYDVFLLLLLGLACCAADFVLHHKR